MKKFYIDIAYYISDSVEVEAKSEEEARRLFRDKLESELDLNQFHSLDEEHFEIRGE